MAPPSGEARQPGVARVPLVNKTCADSAGPGVEVFVAAPNGKISVPVVQLQAEISGGVRHIETNNTAPGMRGIRDAGTLEGLAGEIVDATEENESRSEERRVGKEC